MSDLGEMMAGAMATELAFMGCAVLAVGALVGGLIVWLVMR